MTEGVVAGAATRKPEAEAEAPAKAVAFAPGAPAPPWFRGVRDNLEEAFAFYCKVREQKNLANYVRDETARTNAWLGPNPSAKALRAFHEERGLFFDWLADSWEGEMLALVDREVAKVCALVVKELREKPPGTQMPSREQDERELRRVLTELNIDDFAERFSEEALAPYERFTDPRWHERIPSTGLTIDERRALHFAYLMCPPTEEPSREALLALARWVSPMVAVVDSFDRIIDQQLTARVTHAMRRAMVGQDL